jgi:ectoine hydroxylase-related dioxygenase (phytanoyl-CoA dioxygenase family)
VPAVETLPAFDEPFALDAATVESFRSNGHCVVRGLAGDDEVDAYRAPIEELVARWAEKVPPLERRDTYHKAFLQVPNLWRQSETVARFVLAPRFARVAAELMGVGGVRLYHDQALCKEPGGGYTPWHQDQRYWPLATEHTITMWMPLVDVPADVGTMSFASGSHARGELGPWVIGDDSEAGFDGVVRELALPVETHGALHAGDATFHAGWTLHRAPANGSDLMRSVMTVIWFADGTRVGAVGPTSIFDHQLWLDMIPEGDLAAGPLNPLAYPTGP